MIGTGHRKYAVPEFMQAAVPPAAQQPPVQQPPQPQPQAQAQTPIENGRNNLPNPTALYALTLEPGTPTVFRTYPAEAAGAHLRASSSSQPPLTSPPPPPSLRADVCCRDAGSASPRCLRMTHWELPARAETARAMALPLGCVVTPLAEPAAGEAAVPLVDAGAAGPLRCARCHAYVSPFVRFAPGGAEYACAVCGARNDVPAWFGALRAAEPAHAVLTRGTVEYALDGSPLYAAAAPRAPPVLCVVLDASRAALAAGRTAAAAHALRDIVAAGVLQDTRVGFVSYAARAVHFWDVPPAPRRARALVVPDVAAMFCPLADTLFVSPVAARDAVLAFLDRFTELAAALAEDGSSSDSREEEAEGPCFGAAVQDAVLAFKAAGLCGRILAFCGDVPTGGAGALAARDDPARLSGRAASGTASEAAAAEAEERRLLRPASAFYAWLAQQCVAQGVGVDVWALYAAEADLASVGELARGTGGALRAYAAFDAARDGAALGAALWARVARPWGCQGAFRVRASRGLGVRDYCGAGAPAPGGASVDLALVDSAATLAVRLAHEGDLAPGRDAVVQAALLYTTRAGARRVRVHTVALPVTPACALVYRGLDGDALAACLARLGARDVAAGTAPAAVARAHTRMLADALATYRAECAPDRARSQLVLPDTAQLLPLHVLAMQKLPLFRARACRADQRTALLRAVETLPVPHTLLCLYPRLYSLGSLYERLQKLGNDSGGSSDGSDSDGSFDGSTVVVEATRLARGSQNVNDVYLADDGTDLHVWLTGKPPAALLAALFGALPAGAAQSLAAVGAVRPADAPALEACLAARLAAAPAAGPPLVRALAALVARLAAVPPGRAPVRVRVATASMRAPDTALAWLLAVEDAADGPSYPEYIRTLHTLVRQRFA